MYRIIRIERRIKRLLSITFEQFVFLKYDKRHIYISLTYVKLKNKNVKTKINGT